MTRLSLIIFSLIVSISAVKADDNFCRKCQIMREYHQNNPSKYTYYDDYLKDLEEKGADEVNPRFEDLPEDVQTIIDPAKKNQQKSR